MTEPKFSKWPDDAEKVLQSMTVHLRDMGHPEITAYWLNLFRAAPDLYAACEAVVAAHHYTPEGPVHERDYKQATQRWSDAFGLIFAALAKARGEQ